MSRFTGEKVNGLRQIYVRGSYLEQNYGDASRSVEYSAMAMEHADSIVKFASRNETPGVTLGEIHLTFVSLAFSIIA